MFRATSLTFSSGSPLTRKLQFLSVLAVVTICVTTTQAMAQGGRDGERRSTAPPTKVRLEGEAAGPDSAWTLWYRQPARQWVEALPIGNGRLGAMIFGGVDNERVQLNEDTLWGGGPYDASDPEALATLPEARKLVFDGKYVEAQKLISEKMMGKPLREQPFQPVGDLLLSFPGIEAASDYRRDLDIDTAVSRVSFTSDGTRYTREYFASPVDQVIVIRLTADKPGKVSLTATMQSPQKATVEAESPATLVLNGINGDYQGLKGQLRFQARARVIAKGGKTQTEHDKVTVTGADSATMLIAAATSFKNYKDVGGDPEAQTREDLAAASDRSVDDMLKDHVEEHQRLFRRVSIDLGTSDAAKRPTDVRVRESASSTDPELASLYFQYGRYLLIASSRPGTQPATLQGIWNESMRPPWESAYTININTEMNYWHAESTNLAECAQPLIELVMDLSESGARVAKTNYGADGWVAHHNTDLWRNAAPCDKPASGFWPCGGAWLCRHLWDHYDYSRDKEFLAKAYPAMKGSAEFFLDTLVEDPKSKYLVTCPSHSPENVHLHGTSICAGPTMDMQILRDLFQQCIDASEILRKDSEFREQLKTARGRLAPNQIGKEGQLQEWLEDWDSQARDIRHRHVSHLYGLFPSEQINVRDTPDLVKAAKKTLDIRGDETTGWGIGWRLNLFARLHDAEHSHKILSLLLRPERTYPNLFDAHPPFQIDGNFGGTCGIAEMLMQSWGGEIILLPALPKAWPTGKIAGLRARGGFELDLSWKDGKLAGVVIRSTQDSPCTLRYGDKVIEVATTRGDTIALDGQLERRATAE